MITMWWWRPRIFLNGPSTRASNHSRTKRFILIAKHINLIDYMIILLCCVFRSDAFSSFSSSSSLFRLRHSFFSIQFPSCTTNRPEKRFPKINYVSKIPRSCFLSPLKPIFVLVYARPLFLFLPPTDFSVISIGVYSFSCRFILFVHVSLCVFFYPLFLSFFRLFLRFNFSFV